MRQLATSTSIAVGVLLLVVAWVIYEPPAEDVGEVGEVTQPEPDEAPEVAQPEPDEAPVEARPAPDEAPEGEPLPDLTETLFPAERDIAEREVVDPEPKPSQVRFEELPTSIQVPAIDVDHPLIPVGLNPDGSMEIPHNVQEIGWYEPQGVLPGDEGTAVLAGHVDSRTQGPGAFYDLRHLDVGDGITITDGEQDQEWVVTARRSYDKDLIPIEDIFIDHGEPRLVLVTCGGAFDRTARSYTDNIVVYAELG